MLYSGGEELVLILHGNSDLLWGLCGPALGCTVCKSSVCCVPRNRPWPSVGTQCRLVSLKTQALPGLGFGGSCVVLGTDCGTESPEWKKANSQGTQASAMMLVRNRAIVDIALTGMGTL